jgi:hypothetical protein
MPRRAALAVALLSLVLWLSASAAASVSAAGVIPVTCPNGDASPLPHSSYRIGETIPFFGTYVDFGNPGTVTITFTRADGLTRTYQAFNVADGSWMRNVVFASRSFAGSWRLHIVVTQASGTDICDGRFTLLVAIPPGNANPTLPPTDAAAFERGPAGAVPPGLLLVLGGVALLAAAGTLLIGGRRRI